MSAFISIPATAPVISHSGRKDGDGAGRVLGRGGESFVLQDVQTLREKAVRKDSNIDNNLLFFILRAAKLCLADSKTVGRTSA